MNNSKKSVVTTGQIDYIDALLLSRGTKMQWLKWIIFKNHYLNMPQKEVDCMIKHVKKQAKNNLYYDVDFWKKIDVIRDIIN